MELLGSKNRCSLRGGSAIALCLAVTLSVALMLFPGCGDKNSPEGAVREYLRSWEKLDWAAHKASVVPDKRKLTKLQDDLARQKFEQIKVSFEGLKYDTAYDKKDRNRAVVRITAGKMTYRATIAGEEKTETKDIGKMKEEEKPFFDVLKVKGKWYVDISL